MYASIGTAIPKGTKWTFEPKYDGIRVLAVISPTDVHLITRNGKDKSAQFPELVKALRQLATRRKRSMILDGEIVAVKSGKPERFQALQSRMHVRNAAEIREHVTANPVAYVLFDILADGNEILLRQPWAERRRLLEQRIGKRPPSHLVITDSVVKSGEQLLRRARRVGWEGIIAKRVDSVYQPGVRSYDWLKLKVEFRQEFVIGGYTEPRNTRQYIGALLLGYFDNEGKLIYVGHTGGGFTQRGLADMYALLKPLERKRSPFSQTIKTNQRAHWVAPKIVVEVKFSEWTSDGRLRQPIYLGTRDDKDARTVGREPESVQ